MKIYIISLPTLLTPLVSHHWFYWKARAVESKAFHAARQETPDSCKGFVYGKKVRWLGRLWFCGDVVILYVGVSGVSWLGRQVRDLYWKAWGIRGSLFVLKLWVGVVRWHCRPWDLPCNCGSILREIGRYLVISVDVRDECDLKWFWRVWWWLPMCLAA